MTPTQLPEPPGPPEPITAAEAAAWLYKGARESWAYKRDRRRRIARAVAAGQETRDVAGLMDVSTATVRTAAAEFGVVPPHTRPRPRGGRPPLRTPAEWAAFDWGVKTDGDVAREVGCRRCTVRAARRAAGVGTVYVRDPARKAGRPDRVSRAWGLAYDWADKTDAAVAADLGCSRQHVSAVRAALNIPTRRRRRLLAAVTGGPPCPTRPRS